MVCAESARGVVRTGSARGVVLVEYARGRAVTGSYSTIKGALQVYNAPVGFVRSTLGDLQHNLVHCLAKLKTSPSAGRRACCWDNVIACWIN